MTERFKIYPSITTCRVWENTPWTEKVEELKRLKIKAVCLFPTLLPPPERHKLYRMLEETSVEHIPLVHLRGDFSGEEIEYFEKRFQTRLFNLHSKREFEQQYDLTAYRDRIYLETTGTDIEKEVKNYAGVCFDTAHVEVRRLEGSRLYDSFIGCLERFPVGVAHISAVAPNPRKAPHLKLRVSYDAHSFQSLSEFDYLKRYRRYLPETLALELESPLVKQMEVQSYLARILG